MWNDHDQMPRENERVSPACCIAVTDCFRTCFSLIKLLSPSDEIPSRPARRRSIILHSESSLCGASSIIQSSSRSHHLYLPAPSTHLTQILYTVQNHDSSPGYQRKTHPLKVHTLHSLIHTLDDTAHGIRNTPHSHCRFNP